MCDPSSLLEQNERMLEALTPNFLRTCLMLAINLALGFLMFTRVSDWNRVIQDNGNHRQSDDDHRSRGSALDWNVTNGVHLGAFCDASVLKAKLHLSLIHELSCREIACAARSAIYLEGILT